MAEAEDIARARDRLIVALDVPNVRLASELYGTLGDSVTFYTSSDDGSRLWIDGTPVVDNDGIHPPIERSGSIALTVPRSSVA